MLCLRTGLYFPSLAIFYYIADATVKLDGRLQEQVSFVQGDPS